MTTHSRTGRAVKAARSAFTLVEVLVALALMVLVIPVIVHGLSVAGMAGEVAQRKVLAARVADRLLGEAVVMRAWNTGVMNGVEQEGGQEFRWTLRNDDWSPNDSGVNTINPNVINTTALHQYTMEVTFTARNQDYTVRLATLVDTTQQ